MYLEQMRVLTWSPFINLGGGIRLLSSLSRALAAHPEIDTLGLALPASLVDSFVFSNPKLKLLPIRKPFLTQLTEDAGSHRDLKRMGRKVIQQFLPNYAVRLNQRALETAAESFDVVYIFWPHGVPFTPVQKPIVCTYQDTTFLDFPEIMGGPVREREFEYARSWVSQATELVVSSNAVRNRLVHYFGALGERATIIHHNILTMSSVESALPKNPIQLPERFLLYPANINVHKNHEALLIAWSRFAERERLPLVLVGEYTHILQPEWNLRDSRYWLHDHLVGLVRRVGLQHGRDYYALGYVSNAQMEQVLRAATGLIMPTLSEGGGSYPAEEALAYGVPLLCSDIPVMREHLSARSAEVLWFDPLSVDSILESLNTFVRDYPRLAQSAQQGMTDPRPSWEDIAEAYVRVFKNAIAKKSNNWR